MPDNLLPPEEDQYLKNVVTIATDQNYLEHTKSLMVNCRRQGKYDGDFCLVLSADIDADYFTSRGVYVLVEEQPRHYRKFAVFSEFYKQQCPNPRGNPEYRWDTVLYLDADVLVQAPLGPLFHEVGWGMIIAELEMFTIRHSFYYWINSGKVERPDTPEAKDLYSWIEENYDLDRQQYNAGVMLYRPRSLPPDAHEQLLKLKETLAPINTHVRMGTDQPIINLYFYDRFERIRSSLFGYWREAWDGAILVHYNSGYAPWINKTPGMAAWWNHKLERPCHDIYLENLAAFEKTFPVILDHYGELL